MPIKMKKLITPKKPIKIKKYQLSVKKEFPPQFMNNVRDIIEYYVSKSKHFTPNLTDDGFDIEMNYSSYYMQDPNYKSYLTVKFDANRVSFKQMSDSWKQIKDELR